MSEGANDARAFGGGGADGPGGLVPAADLLPAPHDAGGGVGVDGAARRVWKAFVGEHVHLGVPLLVAAVPGEIVDFGDRQLVRQVHLGMNDRFEMLDGRWHDTPEAAKASVADMIEQMGRDLIRQADELRAGRG